MPALLVLHDERRDDAWKIEQIPILSFGLGLYGAEILPMIRHNNEGPYLSSELELFTAPQNSDDQFTPQQLEQFKSCLSTTFKVYYKDHKYDRNGEAYFDGHSDRWPHIWSGSVGDFRVTTDQQSYSSAALAHKVDPSGLGILGAGNVVGYTDTRSPYVNAIANDAAVAGPVKGREFLGLWVYEMGNALSAITNIKPEIPADARDRYEVGGEAGAAFEDCVFGGTLNANGSVTRPH